MCLPSGVQGLHGSRGIAFFHEIQRTCSAEVNVRHLSCCTKLPRLKAWKQGERGPEERVWLKHRGAGDSGPAQPCKQNRVGEVAGGTALPAALGSCAFSSSLSAAQQVV